MKRNKGLKGEGVFIWGRLHRELAIQITTASGYQVIHYALVPVGMQLLHKGGKL